MLTRSMRHAGLSLVEVLVGLAVVTTSMLVVLHMMGNQKKASTLLADKMARLDIQRSLTQLLADGSICSLMITGSAPVTFDPVNLGSVTIPPFTAIPSRGVAGATPFVVVDPTKVASKLSPRLFLNSIRLSDLQCSVQPCTPSSNEFSGVLEVAFDNARTPGYVPSLRFPVILKSSGSAGNQTLNGCKLTTSATGGGASHGFNSPNPLLLVTSATESCGGSQPNCPGISPMVSATCPAGYQLSGCGYLVSNWNPVSNGGSSPGDSWHHGAPDDVRATAAGDGCEVDAGGAPGCGVCFKAQAICLDFR